ncbi:MAG: tripartite tricarboxylate transporter permease [Opitutales bacterium]
MEPLLTALGVTFQPYNFLLLLFGSTLGLLVGVLPGLSSPMAIAVLIPITYGMEPISALMILVGIYIGTKTGGAYSAILVRAPGTPAAAATALEGYPMAQRGEAGRALGLSIGASFFGGTLSWVVALPLIGVIGYYAVRISAADLAMIGVLALTMVAGLSGQSLLKGLMAASLGLIISTIGLDEITGVPRLTFGQYQLIGGLSFLAAIIGLFAVATVLSDVPDGSVGARPAKTPTKLSPIQMLKELWGLKGTMTIGSGIGAILGIVPGVGADTAGWLSYAYAKRRHEKHRKEGDRKFGEGVPSGVAAPEAANNAVTSGAAVPMLTLGIPGDASTAIMLGALMLYGLQPGPLFFRDSPEVAYGVVVALGVANLTTLIAAILLLKPFVAVLRVDKLLLLGGVLVLALVGSYASTNSAFEMSVAIGFGILGYLMTRYGYSLPAMALAIILGPLIESNFRRALLITRGDATVFLKSPISLICIIVMLALLSRFAVLMINRRGESTRD